MRMMNDLAKPYDTTKFARNMMIHRRLGNIRIHASMLNLKSNDPFVA